MHKDYEGKRFCDTCGKITTWQLYLDKGKTVYWCGVCRENERAELVRRMAEKGRAWRDTRDDTKHRRDPITHAEIVAEMEMRGSFYPPREWVGIHFCNLIHMKPTITLAEIEREIAKRLLERPDLKRAYDLFMKPFRQ